MKLLEKKGSKLKKILLICWLGIALTLSGCAGAVPWNKQNYAGMEEWSVEYVVPDGEGGIERVHYINGKEAASSEIKIALADGTILNFAGDGIMAFQGQSLRADVEKAVSEQLGEVGPGVVDAIINAIIRPD